MPVKPFVLQFEVEELQRYADAFSYKRDPTPAATAGSVAAATGCYTKAGVLDVVNWKSPRTKPRITSTTAAIEAATAEALAAEEESLRMKALTNLPGIEVPIASALLLYACGESYPILDVNALASLGHRRRGVYPTEFWLRYLCFVRALAESNGMSARQVEKALWEFEKQRQARCGPGSESGA